MTIVGSNNVWPWSATYRLQLPSMEASSASLWHGKIAAMDSYAI